MFIIIKVLNGCWKMNKNICGTGIFNFKERCLDCGLNSLVDINGFCKDCYIEDIEKEILKGGLKE